MPRLEARPETGQSVFFNLAPGKPLVLGRSPEVELKLEQEPRLSRRHAELFVEAGKLRVRRLPEASNPIFRAGAPAVEFNLEPGDYFVIGRTRFWFFADDAAPARPKPEGAAGPAASAASMTLSKEDLYSLGTVGPTDRLRLRDLLELPGVLRLRSRDDFYAHVAGLIMHATGAAWACACAEDGEILGEAGGPTGSLSRAVLAKALADAPRPTLYRWGGAADYKATAFVGVDWAICAAAAMPGEPSRVFYAVGAGQRDQNDLAACAQFVGLVSDMVSRAVANDHLHEQQGRLKHFFPGPVVEKVLTAGEQMSPRLARSTVMFFDIRGFSKITEQKADMILQYVQELRAVMTAMTEIVQRENGVVLQYLGDGILACWNVPFDDPAHVDEACRAALEMGDRLQAVAGWKCGVGIHSGDVVAGALGSEQIFAYGLLGPVVNQASRVEGLTKLLGVPIIVTASVAQAVSPAAATVFRLGRFQPAGMDTPLELFGLRKPGVTEPGDAPYTRGLALFEKGDFDGAIRELSAAPVDCKIAQFLVAQAIELKRYPPSGWAGVIKMAQK